MFAKGSVRSADGTQIVVQRGGSGPPLLMVHGRLATSAMYLLLTGERADQHARRSMAMLRESLPVLDTIALAGRGPPGPCG